MEWIARERPNLIGLFLRVSIDGRHRRRARVLGRVTFFAFAAQPRHFAAAAKLARF